MAKSPKPVPAAPHNPLKYNYKIWDVGKGRYLRNDTGVAFCDDIVNDGDDSEADAVKALQFVMDTAIRNGYGKEWCGSYEIHAVVAPVVIKRVNVELTAVLK